MANAKKCDRCGAFYMENTRFPQELCGNKTVLDGACFTAKNGAATRYTDLCDDCIEKLELFLSGAELKED